MIRQKSNNYLYQVKLDDIDEEKRYWMSKSPLERIEAIEINRRMIYGQDQVTSRLQRFLEVAVLK